MAPPVAVPPAEPSETPVAAADTAAVNIEQAAIIGGGALALFALGGAAFAIRRRRRHADEDAWEYEAYEPEHAVAAPVAAPVVMTPEPASAPEPVAAARVAARPQPVLDLNHNVLAPAASAFAWGSAKPVAGRSAPKADPVSNDGSDRRPGETWVERAHRGPSPANPSVSLKNRLRRAAFFDKRERDVAAGVAVPVDPDAGLPDNIEAPAMQRHLEAA